MHSPCFSEKDPFAGTQSGASTEKMAERRDLCSWGMCSFQWLLKLLRISEKDESVRGLRACEHVHQCELPCLVNKQNVDSRFHLFARP